MRRFALILGLVPSWLGAEEFKTLTGDEILLVLSGQKLNYGEGAWQTFDDTMLTQYFFGQPSSGRWTVREDQYCSLLPPSDLWVCYDVLQAGQTIRFVDDRGGATDGVFE
ncbi:hypothetical protein [Ruegeria arenilitoris]|uniref:hypothetical protein n=1 Tax=Ruegeria arenilitoris TaxID=1173585 RepID=UPI00147F1DC2|nr:hypothetical protein [Ruegeria arenilitoris]